VARLKRVALAIGALLLIAASPPPSPNGANNYYYSGNWYYGSPLASPAGSEKQNQANGKTPAAQAFMGVPQAGLSPQAQPATDQSSHLQTQAPPSWCDRLLIRLWQINWSNWALVFVAVWAGRIAVGTLNQIRCQTVAATTAALAAKTSAETADRTLTELERPWVFVDIYDVRNWSSVWPAGQTQIIIGLEWAVYNGGRSPALLIDGVYRIDKFPVPIPEKPDYGPSQPYAVVPLAPNAKPQVFHAQLPIFKKEHEQLINGDLELVFYGFVKYLDSLKKEHVSRWIARFTIPHVILSGQIDNWWTRNGPAAYIEYT
jgi:hypothetical protein